MKYMVNRYIRKHIKRWIQEKYTEQHSRRVCQSLTVFGPRQTPCPWTGLGRATPVYSSGNVSLGWPSLFSVSRLVTSSG